MNKAWRVLGASFALVLFGALLLFLFLGLSKDPGVLPSALIGKALPSFELPDLLSNTRPLNTQAFKGQTTLLIVWATWCPACEEEHAFLMQLAKNPAFKLKALAYKDSSQALRLFLKKRGNPYQQIGLDNQGAVALDLGVYGTPETFIINAKGIIVYRQVGALTRAIFETELEPVLKKLH